MIPMRNRVANSSKVIEKIKRYPQSPDNLDRLATHVLFVNRTSSLRLALLAQSKQRLVYRRSHEPQLHRERLIVPARCWDTDPPNNATNEMDPSSLATANLALVPPTSATNRQALAATSGALSVTLSVGAAIDYRLTV